ncbi:hypothetical protein [Mycolicibacter kumamotonensis]|uniref:hypothetical protein n=1 Tax=Mycolicibacter kumamotonensis TaxID=354243 RepID=UPI0010427F05|nr:hypothetical protein [Mycolicibacter kumamotonensis]
MDHAGRLAEVNNGQGIGALLPVAPTPTSCEMARLDSPTGKWAAPPSRGYLFHCGNKMTGLPFSKRSCCAWDIFGDDDAEMTAGDTVGSGKMPGETG